MTARDFSDTATHVVQMQCDNRVSRTSVDEVVFPPRVPHPCFVIYMDCKAENSSDGSSIRRHQQLQVLAWPRLRQLSGTLIRLLWLA